MKEGADDTPHGVGIRVWSSRGTQSLLSLLALSPFGTPFAPGRQLIVFPETSKSTYQFSAPFRSKADLRLAGQPNSNDLLTRVQPECRCFVCDAWSPFRNSQTECARADRIRTPRSIWSTWHRKACCRSLHDRRLHREPLWGRCSRETSSFEPLLSPEQLPRTTSRFLAVCQWRFGDPPSAQQDSFLLTFPRLAATWI